jgi:hypothetical protein
VVHSHPAVAMPANIRLQPTAAGAILSPAAEAARWAAICTADIEHRHEPRIPLSSL